MRVIKTSSLSMMLLPSLILVEAVDRRLRGDPDHRRLAVYLQRSDPGPAYPAHAVAVPGAQELLAAPAQTVPQSGAGAVGNVGVQVRNHFRSSRMKTSSRSRSVRAWLP